MGSWGYGVFDCDAGEDFSRDIVTYGSPRDLEYTLQRFLATDPDPRIPFEEALAAAGIAELMARSHHADSGLELLRFGEKPEGSIFDRGPRAFLYPWIQRWGAPVPSLVEKAFLVVIREESLTDRRGWDYPQIRLGHLAALKRGLRAFIPVLQERPIPSALPPAVAVRWTKGFELEHEVTSCAVRHGVRQSDVVCGQDWTSTWWEFSDFTDAGLFAVAMHDLIEDRARKSTSVVLMEVMDASGATQSEVNRIVANRSLSAGSAEGNDPADAVRVCVPMPYELAARLTPSRESFLAPGVHIAQEAGGRIRRTIQHGPNDSNPEVLVVYSFSDEDQADAFIRVATDRVAEFSQLKPEASVRPASGWQSEYDRDTFRIRHRRLFTEPAWFQRQIS